MQQSFIQSAGRRFVKKFGFAFAWAAVYGALVGALVYYRVPRVDRERALFLRPRAWLEKLELWTYDLRAADLGERSSRSDRVVIVSIDDESLASARSDQDPRLGGYPWARQALGGVSDELLREGASLVVLDFRLGEPSPRSCPGSAGAADDVQLRALLDLSPGRTLLPFSWRAPAARATPRQLRPLLMSVETRGSLEQARPLARQLLAEGVPPYLIPEGTGVEVWAGLTREEEARSVASRLGLKGSFVVRPRTAAEQEYEVAPWELLVAEAFVQVKGLDPTNLPRARSLETPVPALLDSKSLYGAADLLADSDGVVRGVPLLVSFSPREGRSWVLPSLPLAAAMRLAGTRELSYEGGQLRVGDKLSIPMDESGYALLRWDAAEAGRGARGTLRRSISAWRLLVNRRDQQEGRGVAHYDHDLKDRVTILADTSSHAGDFLATPVADRLPRAAVLGQSIANLLGSAGIERASRRVDVAATLALSFLGAVLAVGLSRLFRTARGVLAYYLSVALAGSAYVAFARYLFVERQLWVAVGGPLLAMTATFLTTTTYALRLERSILEFINAALGRTMSPELARKVTGDLSLMRPERRVLTVLFCDVVGFTRRAEKVDPAQVVRALNQHLTDMSDIVHATGGHVDKYVGDAVVALWGAPVPLEGHAARACESALRMRELVLRSEETWRARLGEAVSIQVGVNSGEVVVGYVGSVHKANYTVIGEAAGLAARLERDNGRYGTAILVGETTCATAGDGFIFREVDRVRRDGKAVPERIFELIAKKGALGEAELRRLGDYSVALAAYHERRFEEALAGFTRLAAEDRLSALYADRCRAFLKAPPPPSWDGTPPG